MIVIFATAAACYFLLMIFREWTIALVFRNALSVRGALKETLRLIRANVGSVLLFMLLRFALLVALLVISNVLCCVSCCGERFPYVGTILLLPAVIYLRCFSLDVLAQFGPQYDVFTVDLPPATTGTTAPSPFSPPPQLG